MSTFKLPIEKKFPQNNQGSVLGALASTRNIDLNTPGELRLAQRTNAVGQTSSGNLTDIRAIEHWRNSYRIASDRMFNIDNDLTGLAEDSGAPAVSISDLAIWTGAALYASGPARIYKLSSNTSWTSPWSTSDFTNNTGTLPHPIEMNVTNGSLLAGDGSTLQVYNSSGVAQTPISLPSGNFINWIRRGIGVNYIGFTPFNFSGDTGPATLRGGVAIWDGLATTTGFNQLIPLNCREALSAVLDDDGVLNIITSDGRLQRFNGSGFTDLAELPPFRDYLARRSWGGTAASGFDRPKVTQRGMKVIKGKIHVTVNAQTTTQNMQPDFQSGVWVYDPDNRAFYLKYTLSNSSTATDYGQSLFTSTPGAICPIYEAYPAEDQPADAVGGVLLTGARLYPNTVAGTALRTVVSVATGFNVGQFSTVKLESPQVTDSGVSIWCKFRGVTGANDKIVFKYRTSERDPVVLDNGTSTWTNGTTFSTTDTRAANIEVGDEITILTGNDAGRTAHVLSIGDDSDPGVTWTVGIDEEMANIANNDTSILMVENWKRVAADITSSDTDGFKRIPLEIGASKYVEVKGELRGEGGRVVIEELSLYTTEHQDIN